MQFVTRKSEIVNGEWLADMDLNHDKQIQSLLCYRYTIGQTDALERLKGFVRQSSRQTFAGRNAVHPEVVGSVGSAGLSPLHGADCQRAGEFRAPLALREAKRRERRDPSPPNCGCTKR